MRTERYRTGQRTPPMVEQPLALLKEGYCLAARLGTPLEPTVYMVAHTRYERRHRSMELTVATLVHGELQPGGSVSALLDRLVELQQHAQDRVGQAGVALYVDVTRSPQIYRGLSEVLPDSMPVTLVAGDIDRPNLPFRVLGRLRLLSTMAMLLSRRILRTGIARLDPTDPNLLTDQRISQAFGAAQIRPPKLDPEELLTESNADDDVAMTAGLAAYAANEQVPSALAKVSGEN